MTVQRPSPLASRRVLLAGRSPRRPRGGGDRRRLRAVTVARITPNLLTVLGLCAGLTAIRFALEGRFEAAAAAIVLAGCVDGLDGRLARLLHATSRFGAEFDSLSDFVCFGVAPALVLYLWSLQPAHAYGFMPCLLFAVCMALRLARFNASLEATAGAGGADQPGSVPGYFTGVPAPAGAGLALMPLFAGLEARHLGWNGAETVVAHPLVAAAMLVGTALLLVCTLPVWSFKHLRLPAGVALPVLLGTGVFAALLVANPWAALASAGVVYLALLPLSLRAYRRHRRAAAAGHQPTGHEERRSG